MYKNCCKNNWNNDTDYECDNDVLETNCSNVENALGEYDDCSCGFDEESSVFPENPVLAQSYVPIQTLNKTFKPSVGLRMGTIYPELVSPYMPGQSMAEIEYLKSRNSIGEGCNR